MSQAPLSGGASTGLAEAWGEQTEEAFTLGHEIGGLARRRFPGGVLVAQDRERLAEAVEETAGLLKNPAVPAIYEATFVHEGVLVRVDILKRVGRNRWRLIEVKASTEVKDHHYDDVAVQTHVLRGAGVELAGCSVLHVNNRYVYEGGDLDLRAYFTEAAVTAEINRRLPLVPERLAAMRATLAASAPPAIEPDGHCRSPYACQFWSHCTKDKPERWTFYLPRIGKKFEALRERGVESIDDIPTDFLLSAPQRRVKANVEWIAPGLKRALAALQPPVHHLDFETFNPGVPRYAGTGPYQQIAFQWSDHVEEVDGTIRHLDYLHAERTDPREPLAVALLNALGKQGSLVVFTGFEGRVIRELAEALPRLRRDLDRLHTRLWDLNAVLKQHYYHPGFVGSYSLKAVLPALLPELGYGDLAIQEGTAAAEAYAAMVFGSMPEGERTRLRHALLAYCGRDTEGLLRLRERLREKA